MKEVSTEVKLELMKLAHQITDKYNSKSVTWALHAAREIGILSEPKQRMSHLELIDAVYDHLLDKVSK